MGLGVEVSLEGSEWKRSVAVERIFIRMASRLKGEASHNNLFLANQMHQTTTGKITGQGTLLGG